jgi:hypothetical protein
MTWVSSNTKRTTMTPVEEVGFLSRYKEAMLFVVAQERVQKDI